MAELIHTFTSGKMNKDLDERLVPNGEYRDALNLELASSDSSQVGTFQNIKGNLELAYKTYNPITGARTSWSSAYISNLTNAVCIGSVVDKNTDNIYWFISSDEASAIAYYNDVTKVVAPLIVDANSILKFSKDYLITGVNVLEGILMWTDNQTEPKSITIKDWIGSTPDFLTHSQTYSRAFIEQDVTVIKKYPLQPPTLVVNSTTKVDNNGAPAVVTTSVNFSFAYEDAENNIVPFTPENGPQQMTWNSQPSPPFYEIGEILLFNFTGNEDASPDASIRGQVMSVVPSDPNATQTGAMVTILSVGNGTETQTTDVGAFDVTLEQVDPTFEFRFARFAYRYKYKNNQISAFSPFTNPAFLPGEFEYNAKNGYNLGMVNNIRQLEINNFRPADMPEDVVEIDILYKATNNPNVYVVDSFTSADDEWTNNKFNIKTEIITSVVKSNQLLRPYDNVPRKAKSQEIVANRLIYGNYVQNFNLSNPAAKDSRVHVNLSTGVLSRTIYVDGDESSVPGTGVNIDGNLVAQSVKSIRTYQAGVAYMDIYGRTTPVFTSSGGAINLPKNQSAASNQITVKVNSPIPSPAPGETFPYFKYYIKETSQPYYNLCLDRFYDAEDGNLWLSFPSSERNKVDEETFLILKKEHDNANPVLDNAAKYKILAISNEAPQFLRESRNSKGTLSFDAGPGMTAPVEGATEIFVTGGLFDDTFGIQTRSTSGLLLRVSSPGTTSDYYKITTFGLAETAALTSIRIVVSKPFGDDMAFATDSLGLPVSGLSLTIYELVDENKPEFTGRFFVKVNRDGILTERIAAAAASEPEYARRAFGFLYYARGTYTSRSFWRDDDKWRTPDGQGETDRLFIDYIKTDCVNRQNGLDEVGRMKIGYATGYGAYNTRHGIAEKNPALLTQLDQNGALFRFIEAPGSTISNMTDTIYKVIDTHYHPGTTYNCGSDGRDNAKNQKASWNIKFVRLDSEVAGLDWNPITDGNLQQWSQSTSNYSSSFTGLEYIGRVVDEESFTTTNPAIFETEPKEAAELDIYWEVPGAYTAAQHGQTHTLDWFNCYSFGNGVESDRIRDDFNQPLIENGVKASATLEEPYGEEHRSTGLIFSQIFNSISSTNNLNQFIQAESITKDVNPEYGSIQKLHTRDTDLITLCENKSMKILAKKDALFNADGSTNLTSNAAVLGQTLTFQGEFGIATNPESFAEFGFRMYYTDANRGAVLRLSGDGITDISDYGMHSFFSDNLPINDRILGSWDVDKRNYNVTLKSLTPYWQQTLGAGEFDRLNRDPLCNQFINTLPTYSTTISFKEQINGFTSRKVYIPEAAAYLNNIYYTFKNGRIWEHGLNEKYNTFYNIGPDNAFAGPYYEGSFNTIFNDQPAIVKGYKTLNYSGTDAKEYLYKLAGSERLYTLAQIQAKELTPASSQQTQGWYVNSIVTDLQEGQIKEFIDKEGKKFNYIKGMDTFYVSSCNTNVDTKEFNVQGIGNPSVIVIPPQTVFTVTNQADPNCSTP